MTLLIQLLLMAAANIVGESDKKMVCTNTTGIHDGYFYTFWQDSGSACMDVQGGGSYRVDWKLPPHGNLVVGRGWAEGSLDRIVQYRVGEFVPGSNGYLSLYGWSVDPLVEYYIIEERGDFHPPGAAAVFDTTFVSDGSAYRVYHSRRVDRPSIKGNATFNQYWSVRITPRGRQGEHKITFRNHVTAWRKLGLRLGRLNYQIMAVEGFGSTGHAEVDLID